MWKHKVKLLKIRWVLLLFREGFFSFYFFTWQNTNHLGMISEGHLIVISWAIHYWVLGFPCLCQILPVESRRQLTVFTSMFKITFKKNNGLKIVKLYLKSIQLANSIFKFDIYNLDKFVGAFKLLSWSYSTKIKHFQFPKSKIIKYFPVSLRSLKNTHFYHIIKKIKRADFDIVILSGTFELH